MIKKVTNLALVWTLKKSTTLCNKIIGKRCIFFPYLLVDRKAICF